MSKNKKVKKYKVTGGFRVPGYEQFGYHCIPLGTEGRMISVGKLYEVFTPDDPTLSSQVITMEDLELITNTNKKG